MCVMSQSVSVEEPSQGELVSETVVSAVAEATGTDPLSLEPLYRAVDPDALNALFEQNQTGINRSPNRIEFTYCECDITVTTDGAVSVSKSDQEVVKVEGWM